MRIGEKVYVAGNPKGLEGTFSDGIISRISTQGNRKRLQMTAPISPGSSGGPVLNSKGEVIGVAFMTLRGGQNLNFAIPSKYVKTLLDTKALVTPLSKVKENISADTYYKRGNTKYNLGLYKSAILDYTDAIRLNPDFAEVYISRGAAKSSLSEYFAAIRDYDTAIRLNPDNAIAHANRGISMYSLGRNMEAKTGLEYSLETRNRGRRCGTQSQYRRIPTPTQIEKETVLTFLFVIASVVET